MTPQVWIGESLRWYLTRARHPFKNYVVGHYWRWFCKPRVWVRYDGHSAISVGLGDYLQQRIFFDGYYERALIEWLKRTLEPSDVFWDVGANIGAVTLVAAPLCRRVVAFEPDPRSLEQLNRHLAMNHLTNVEVVPAALGDRAGRGALHQSLAMNTGMTSLMSGRGETAGSVDVEILAADEFVSARPDLTPTVMKVDVEGAEHLVLMGASRLLRDGRIRALVFEDRRDGSGRPTNEALMTCLASAGYAIQPFGLSEEHTDDGMFNFLATPGVAEAARV